MPTWLLSILVRWTWFLFWSLNVINFNTKSFTGKLFDLLWSLLQLLIGHLKHLISLFLRLLSRFDSHFLQIVNPHGKITGKFIKLNDSLQFWHLIRSKCWWLEFWIDCSFFKIIK